MSISAPVKAIREVIHPWWMRLLSLAFVSGILEFLAHPGWECWWLGPVAMVPLALVVAERRGPWIAAGCGFATGTTAWAGALCWLPEALAGSTSLGERGAWVISAGATIIQAFPYCIGLVGASILHEQARVPVPLSFPIGMLAGEIFVPTLLPYSHAISWLELDLGRSLISNFGRDVSSFSALLTSAYLAEAGRAFARRERAKALGFVSQAGATLLVTLAIAKLSLSVPSERTSLRFALVQASVELGEKRDAPRSVLRKHLLESRKQERAVADIDLFVWGETMLSQARTPLRQRSLLDVSLKTPVLAGAVLGDSSCDNILTSCGWKNGAVLSHHCGKRCSYEKARLVPFSESNPSWMREAFGVSPSEFEPGDGASTVAFRDHALGLAICYEGIFPERARAAAREGAEIWINLVSDRWVASKMGRRAHEALARLSAVERGLPLLRLVDDGPTRVWDARGTLLESMDAGVEGTLIVRPPLVKAASFFHENELAIRGAFGASLIVGVVLAALWRRRTVMAGLTDKKLGPPKR